MYFLGFLFRGVNCDMYLLWYYYSSNQRSIDQVYIITHILLQFVYNFFSHLSSMMLIFAIVFLTFLENILTTINDNQFLHKFLKMKFYLLKIWISYFYIKSSILNYWINKTDFSQIILFLMSSILSIFRRLYILDLISMC